MTQTTKKNETKATPKATKANPAPKAAPKAAAKAKPAPKTAPKAAAKAKPAPKAAPKAAAAPKAKKAPAVAEGLLQVDVAANSIQWTINPKVYPLEVVYQAAFVFIDRAYMLLDYDAAGNILVTLKGKATLKKAELEALQGEFANELLNQAVRRTLSRQNRRLRELIVAKALFAAGRPQELREIMGAVSPNRAPGGGPAPRPWDEATQEEQDELDRLLAEIEQDFADDPMGIAVPWDEKYGDKGGSDEGGSSEPA